MSIQEALRLLLYNRRWAQNLWRFACLLVILNFVLVGCLFGIATAAVDLTKDTNVVNNRLFDRLLENVLQVFCLVPLHLLLNNLFVISSSDFQFGLNDHVVETTLGPAPTNI